MLCDPHSLHVHSSLGVHQEVPGSSLQTVLSPWFRPLTEIPSQYTVLLSTHLTFEETLYFKILVLNHHLMKSSRIKTKRRYILEDISK
jgi:hypothetical protein